MARRAKNAAEKKRIIVCLDGTWNKVDSGKRITNIVRIRDSLRNVATGSKVFQRIYYDEGVGTGDNPWDKYLGGAFGIGLARNVRQAYKYISRHYEPGDEIHIVGFSRGAFTARSVSGMIGACGVLHRDACTSENEELIWSYYHTDQKDRPPGDEAKWRDICHRDVPIESVAVFDTVGALGIPDRYLNWILRSRFSFHDTRLGRAVKNAFHAVSIDEKRQAFTATLWERPFNATFGNVEQVWFPGVHADIGGGYREPELSRIALDWMAKKLSGLGVEFHAPKLEAFGIGPAASLEPAGTLHESRKLLPYFNDWVSPQDRPITDRTPIRGVRGDREQLRYDPIGEAVHRSALDRALALPDYRPVNLMAALGLIAKGTLRVIDWDGAPMSKPDAAALAGEIA